MRPEVTEYRLAPEIRRCCWYWIVGLTAMTPVVYQVGLAVEKGTKAEVLAGCAVFQLFAAAGLIPLRWRLRIDDSGVARRRFWWWDIWSWDDLASGRIEKHFPLTLYDPRRTWWRRSLRLGSLAQPDKSEVMARINARYQLPPAPEVPVALELDYDFRKKIRLEEGSIQVSSRKSRRLYAWDDIQVVRLTRMDPLRRDFSHLLIVLPDNEVELKVVSNDYGTNATWRGASASQINEFLFAHAPPEKLEVVIAGEPPTSRDHLEYELRKSRKQSQVISRFVKVLLPLYALMIVWRGIDSGLPAALYLLCCTAIFPGSFLVYLIHAQRKKTEELTALLNKAPLERRPSAFTT